MHAYTTKLYDHELVQAIMLSTAATTHTLLSNQPYLSEHETIEKISAITQEIIDATLASMDTEDP